jgi:subtilase family serine protease
MHMSVHNKATTLLRTVAVTTLCILSAASTNAVAQTDVVTLEGSKPRLLENAARVGSVADSKRITISVYLKFRNMDDLDQLLEDQQTPGSARYQQFLTPEEFHQKYSPLPADVAKVKRELVRMGLQIVDAPVGGLFVTARGTVGQIKSVFHVSQELYSVRGQTVRSHAEAPVVPASIAPLVLHIAGLDDTKKFIRTYETVRAGDTVPARRIGTNDDPPINGIWYTRSPCNVDYSTPVVGTVTPAAYTTSPKMDFTNCGYTPDQIRQAYGVNKVASTGKGIRIGLVDLYVSSTLEQDLNQYSSLHNLPQVNWGTFQEITAPGLGTPSEDGNCGPASWSVESTLDVEAAHTIAPGADIVYLGDACNEVYPLPMQAMYNAIDNRLADILSGSFGGPELAFATGQEDADNQEFKQAASLGISLMFSSGDSADYLEPLGYDWPIAAVSWPASSPWVTAVGGTSLLLDKNGSKAEYGWGTYANSSYGDNWTGPFQIEAEAWMGWGFAGGSGGGTSMFMSQPKYQKGVVPASLSERINTFQTATINLGVPNRVVPDIGMLADPFTGFLQGQTMLENTPGTLDIGCYPISSPANAEYCEFPQGGTSVASPLFAGVMAVIDSARLSTGKPFIGFANPTLYKLSVGSNGSASPIWDVSAAAHPLALIDEELDEYGAMGLTAVGINMDPKDQNDPNTGWILGGDSKLMTTKGYDNVTGLGTPWLPGLIKALAPGAK